MIRRRPTPAGPLRRRTPAARLDRADARADARLTAREWAINRLAVDGVWTCPVCGTALPVDAALDHRCDAAARAAHLAALLRDGGSR